MPDSLPPRIRVTLPGGRDLPGRITRWRQDKTGAWWAAVELYVPAAAVAQVDGEDYTAVPREPAEPRYVLSADTRTRPPTVEMHAAGCWEIAQPAKWRRNTPLSAKDARDQMLLPDTKTCPVCTPAP
jgi:hypothetical protein